MRTAVAKRCLADRKHGQERIDERHFINSSMVTIFTQTAHLEVWRGDHYSLLRADPGWVGALTRQPHIDVLHIIVSVDGFQERLDFRALRFIQRHRVFGAIAQFGGLHGKAIIR